MNKDLFVQNIKFYCAQRNVKPTVACREAGVSASFISNIEGRGQTPSVEKVQMLAQYLGVTVSELLGETSNPTALSDLNTGPPGTLTLHDSAVVVNPSDFTRLTVSEVKMVMAYRAASPEIRRVIDGALEPYKQKETTSGAG